MLCLPAFFRPKLIKKPSFFYQSPQPAKNRYRTVRVAKYEPGDVQLEVGHSFWRDDDFWNIWVTHPQSREKSDLGYGFIEPLYGSKYMLNSSEMVHTRGKPFLFEFETQQMKFDHRCGLKVEKCPRRNPWSKENDIVGWAFVGSWISSGVRLGTIDQQGTQYKISQFQHHGKGEYQVCIQNIIFSKLRWQAWTTTLLFLISADGVKTNITRRSSHTHPHPCDSAMAKCRGRGQRVSPVASQQALFVQIWASWA